MYVRMYAYMNASHAFLGIVAGKVLPCLIYVCMYGPHALLSIVPDNILMGLSHVTPWIVHRAICVSLITYIHTHIQEK
jgi:hypothetical protein